MSLELNIMNRPNISDGPNVQYHILDSHGNTSQAKNRTKYKTISTPTNSRGNNKHCEPQTLLARTYHPPFSFSVCFPEILIDVCTSGGFRGGVRGVRPPKIRKAYVIQR